MLGIQNVDQLRNHPLRGSIFENLVVFEFSKIFLHHGKRAPLYFWRDSLGREVDLVIDIGGRLLPVEIKAGQTPASDFFKGLDYYAGLTGGPSGILVYGGDDSYMRKGHQVVSWRHCSPL